MRIVMECAKLRVIVRDESLELLLHPESQLKQRKKPAKREIHRLEQPPIQLKIRETSTKYLIALVAIVAATWIRMLVDPVVGDRHPFVTYILAIIFTSWYCGMWPAVLALVCGFLAAAYFFATPRGSIAIYGLDMQVGLVLYTVVGFSSIIFSELMHSANRRAESIANELKSKQINLEQEILLRQTAEEERISLLRRFVSLQEEERRHISRELHDHCGQEIIALQLGIKRAVNIIESENQKEANACFQEVNEILSRLSGEIHDLAFDLRPPSLDELGLHTAICSLLELWSERVGITVDFECRNWNEQKLSSEAALTLYRVLQEALNNVAKHSASKHVSIVLEIHGDSAVIIVEDQGVGFGIDFSNSNAMVRQPLGILGMKERLASVGGSLEMESAVGKGATLFARVPLRSNKG